MSKYEDLLKEYEDRILIEEQDMLSEGLYGDGVVWIRKDLPEDRKACILAEEIGHYETSVGDILNQRDLGNARQEHLARGWAYNKLVPLEAIKEAYAHSCRELYEMAEFLSVDEAFLRDSIAYYQSKYGDLWHKEKHQKLMDALCKQVIAE